VSPHADTAAPRARWAILALLFFATTINYLDRIVFSVLIPVIRAEFGFNDLEYGQINAAFQFAYTVGFLFMGRLIDRRGTRFGYALSIAWWSIAAAGHVAANSVLSFGFWRAMLGLGEAGNFPAAIKSVAEWFPKKDRAFATGIFNAGTNVASMIGPPLFAWMVVGLGWRACFLITAGAGFVWLIFWLLAPRPPQSDAELAGPKMSWREAAGYKQTWGFALAKFFSDPVWWFYLYWLPPYFFDVRKMDLKQIGWALPAIYLMADVGSVAGGWVSGWLIRRGWHPGTARKASMLGFALCMPIAALSVLAPDPIVAIALISLATAAHQGWSANLFTTTSDVFPRNAVASVTGIGGAAGGIGGVLFSALVPGYLVTHFGYTPVFLIMGVFHLIGFAFAHFLMGRMEPIRRAGDN
jgi:ACS family hexuronate transporter-like MFS transporter